MSSAGRWSSACWRVAARVPDPDDRTARESCSPQPAGRRRRRRRGSHRRAGRALRHRDRSQLVRRPVLRAEPARAAGGLRPRATRRRPCCCSPARGWPTGLALGAFRAARCSRRCSSAPPWASPSRTCPGCGSVPAVGMGIGAMSRSHAAAAAHLGPAGGNPARAGQRGRRATGHRRRGRRLRGVGPAGTAARETQRSIRSRLRETLQRSPSRMTRAGLGAQIES